MGSTRHSSLEHPILLEAIERFQQQAAAHHHRTGYPFVVASYAQSLDGCIAAVPGERFVLSGEQSMLFTHRLRATHDAILVGIGTLLADDPRLTARKVAGPNPQPIVVDSMLRCPLGARLITAHPTHKPWIITTPQSAPSRREALQALGVDVIPVSATSSGQVNLAKMISVLGQRGIRSVMVEGGTGILTSLLAGGLVNVVILTIAPVILGAGLHAIADLGQPDSFPRLQHILSARLGDDLIVWGELAEA
ncbi:MAG: RibD family protein [Chloroflexi bacterium]|nr:RibD family protein [Chloroflexota bacterium]